MGIAGFQLNAKLSFRIQFFFMLRFQNKIGVGEKYFDLTRNERVFKKL